MASQSTPSMEARVSYPQIERRSGLSEREFTREYKTPRRPVVLIDVAKGWKARSWTLELLRARYGETKVVPNRYDGLWYAADQLKEMRLADFIDGLLTKDWKGFPYYIWDNRDLFAQHPELLADFEVPPYFFDWLSRLPSFMQRPGPRLFIGPKGAVTPFHIDFWGTHGWLTQIIGKKRWIVVSPDQKHLLHGKKVGERTRYEVNPEAPDFEKFPLFRKVRALECTISPGETMFIPGGWFHYVKSVEAGLSLTGNLMGPGSFWPVFPNCLREQVIRRAWQVVKQRV